jgi:putative hydrolase of the HAD superfamily
MAKYSDLVFDLDHTLWDFNSNSSKAIKELYGQFKLEESGFEVAVFHAHYIRENELCWEAYRKGQMDKQTLRSIRFEKALRYIGIEDKTLAENFGEAYIDLSPHQTALMPGTIDLLEYLKGKNYKLHILTNGFEEVQHIKLDKSGLSPFFNEIITSEEVGVRKPDLRIFQHAEKRIGAAGSNVLMIGDNLEADVLGAKHAGWHQVFYNIDAHTHNEELTLEIDDLSSLQAFL